MTTKSILVLTDFSSSALNAADYAMFLAIQLKVNILLFHAYDVSESEPDAALTSDYNLLAQDSDSNLVQEMNRLKLKIKTADSTFIPKIEYLSEGGGVAENACSIIDDHKNILMLVMSGLKAHNDDYIKFGSKINALIKKARCPAVIVPELNFLTT
jgi:nucleotide-binding universal stress UspA family protein